MTPKTTMFAAAVLAGSFAAAPAIAQDATAMSDLMTSMEASQTEAGEIKAMTEVKSVEVIKIGDIAKPEEASALDASVEAKAPAVEDIRGALNGNSAVSAKLAEQNVDVNTVVAANAEADGTLKVYVR